MKGKDLCQQTVLIPSFMHLHHGFCHGYQPSQKPQPAPVLRSSIRHQRVAPESPTQNGSRFNVHTGRGQCRLATRSTSHRQNTHYMRHARHRHSFRTRKARMETRPSRQAKRAAWCKKPSGSSSQAPTEQNIRQAGQEITAKTLSVSQASAGLGTHSGLVGTSLPETKNIHSLRTKVEQSKNRRHRRAAAALKIREGPERENLQFVGSSHRLSRHCRVQSTSCFFKRMRH